MARTTERASRTAGHATKRAGRAIKTASWGAEAVIGAAQNLPGLPTLTARLAPPAGKAVADVMRAPETIIGRARRLPTAAAMVHEAVTPILTGRVDDWRAEHAYATALQAFIYGFPYIYNAKLKHDWVTSPRDPDVVPYAPVNHFWHARKLITADYRDGGCPNNDTLYSIAWLDLRDEPVILSHPDMADRYFTFELMGFSSDNFDYVGQRATGHKAGHFAIVGPGWTGKLPAGVKKAKRAPTPWVLVLGRTLADGQADVKSVRALQAQYKLTPLSKWGKPRAKVPQRRDVYAPGDPTTDPLSPWKSLNAMLAENPPPPHHAVLLDQFARIGIGPGLDVDAQPDVVKRGLLRAAVIGLPLLRQQLLSGSWATNVNGWRYPPPEEGRFGDDFLRRAADQSLAGITANDPAEAVYLPNFEDAKGIRLAPHGRYELRFPPGSLPPADAFWSLTAYTEHDLNLIPNEARRFSVGDRTPGLRREPDGGLVIHLQPRSPGPAREANWLPTSAEHPWFVILRLYRPRPEVIAARWKCPGLRKIG
ncbi:MAG TPA: DUF1254 domain-containing protein [Streptosporangiaceae bacterium]|nr:DUF1254 domain-containing protein [Streptosporangiaceae bacterium]